MNNFPFTIIDLTHPLTNTIPSWDGHCGFSHHTTQDYSDSDSSVKFRVQSITMQAGIGTHMDAPAHCIPNGKTIDAISLQECFSPCVIIDVSKHADEHFVLSPSNIHQFEKQHGQIKAGTFIIVRTGWEKYWATPEQYRNALQFPSVSIETTKLLLERNITGLGIDTLSPDTPKNGYPVHEAMLGAGKYIIENVAHTGLMPSIGGYTLAAPLLVQNGTEASTRLIGFIPNDI